MPTFDIYYQVHAQNMGWMDWAKNGECAGTSAYGYRLEGIKIVILPVGSDPPGDTAMPYERKEFANKDEALEYFIQYCKANGITVKPDYKYMKFTQKGYMFIGVDPQVSSWPYSISPKGSIFDEARQKYLLTIQGDETFLLLETDEDFIQYLTDYLYDNNLYVPEYIEYDASINVPFHGRVYVGYDMFGTEKNRFFRYEIYPAGDLYEINMY